MGGLHLKPLVKPPVKPSQTGPKRRDGGSFGGAGRLAGPLPLRPCGAVAGLRELRCRRGEHCHDADEPRCHAGVAGWGRAVGGENPGMERD